jgi:EmrB/QacA subfamily drug resistance transporter
MTETLETTSTRTEARGDGDRLNSRAKFVLLVLCAANFLVGIDFSILNIALPAIGTDLHIGEANLQWVATAFALPSGGLLLLFGRTGDLIGRRRVFLAGVALFTVASLLTMLAWNPASLLAGRALQGLGAAGVVPTGMALLTTSFPEGHARDRALGIAGSVMATGFTVGTLLGGVLTDLLNWRFTMVLPIVLGVFVLIATPLLVAESRNEHHSRLDVPGAATVTGGLLALIYALTTAAQQGWGRPNVLVTLIGGVLLLAAFIAVEARSAHPLISLKVLRRRTVALGNLGGLVAFAMASSVVFIGMLFLQQINGLSPLRAGLVFGWLGVVAAVSGNVAPRVIGRYGSGTVLVVGLLGQFVGTVLIATMTRGDSVLILLAAGTLWVYFHMHGVVAFNVTATSGLPNEEQGQATGLATTTQQVALTVGIPILSAIAATRQNALLRAGRSAQDALMGGFHLALWVDAAIVLVGTVLLAAGLLRRRSG